MKQALAHVARSVGSIGAVFRNKNLRRLELAYIAFTTAEWATWISMLVFAYEKGGPAAVGVVAMIQLAPSALVAPFAAFLGDRFPPERVIVAAYLGQPRGTVTLVFTDIEGSIRQLASLGSRYEEVLATHRRVLREAFSSHGGVEVDTLSAKVIWALPRASPKKVAISTPRAAMLSALPYRSATSATSLFLRSGSIIPSRFHGTACESMKSRTIRKG